MRLTNNNNKKIVTLCSQAVKCYLQVYPDGRVTPGIMIANTDTRHYQDLSENIFRFSPTHLAKSDLDRFHGLNERISVDNYAQVGFVVLRFFLSLLCFSTFLDVFLLLFICFFLLRLSFSIFLVLSFFSSFLSFFLSFKVGQP